MFNRLSVLILVLFLLSISSAADPGDKIAFVSEQTGNKEIYVINTDGSNTQRITTSSNNDFSPRWSPDGNFLAYLTEKPSGQNGPKKIELNLINLNGEKRKKLIEANLIYDLKWLPSGELSCVAIRDIYEKDVKVLNWIPKLSEAFKKSESGICFVDPQLGEQKISFKMPEALKDTLKSRAWTSKFDISPDGKKTVFTAVVNWSDEEIYVMDNDTGKTKRLTQVVYEFGNVDPVWTRDGQNIIFRKTWKPGADLYLMDAEGGEARKLIQGDIREFVLSPDGKRVAYIDFPLNTNISDKTALKILNLETGRTKTLTNFTALDSRPAWSPNGDEITFVRGSGQESEIYIISTQNHYFKRLTNNKFYDGEPVWRP